LIIPITKNHLVLTMPDPIILSWVWHSFKLGLDFSSKKCYNELC